MNPLKKIVLGIFFLVLSWLWGSYVKPIFDYFHLPTSITLIHTTVAGFIPINFGLGLDTIFLIIGIVYIASAIFL